MSKENLVDCMQRLTKQLKGAPLKEFEIEQLRQGFNQASGSALQRAQTAVTGTLHSNPSYIHEKAEALEDVKRMVDDLAEAARNYEKEQE